MRRLWLGVSVVTTGLILGLTGPRARADESSAGDKAEQQEQQIRTNLEKAPELKNDRIEVKVDDGIAVLEGTVDSQREKKEATQLSHVEGILGVNNRLQIRGGGK